MLLSLFLTHELFLTGCTVYRFKRGELMLWGSVLKWTWTMIWVYCLWLFLWIYVNIKLFFLFPFFADNLKGRNNMNVDSSWCPSFLISFCVCIHCVHMSQFPQLSDACFYYLFVASYILYFFLSFNTNKIIEIKWWSQRC